ncbi:hypothetical protein RB653_007296 [Dictyostelium firmibasis]|uniref:CS domain-containing protein n=1 Tax=Dictyostelium firmibasis TaxID=79012 RepID=A0AAN7YXF7_9MYCE
MIIPKFSVDQNDEFIIVVAITPYIKASEADFYLLENQFKFYCKPYFLRLTFSHNIVEDGKEKASFNVNTQEFTFYLPKEIKGQKFNDLDLITKLLEKKPTNTSKIQVLNDESNQNDEDEDGDDYEDEEWEFEQVVEPEPSLDELKNKIKYGFNDGYSDFFQGLQQDIGDIIDIPIIDSITKQERTKVRTEFEDLKFDPERYMENHFFNDDIKELLHYKCYWEDLIEKKIKLKKEKNQQSIEQDPKEKINEKVEEEKVKEEKVKEEKFIEEKLEEGKLIEKEEIKQIDPSNLEDYDEGNDEVINETTIESNEISDELLEKINSTLSKKISIVNDESENKNILIEKEEEVEEQSNTTTSSKNKYSKKLITFSDEEKDIMKNLPNKEYMISNEKSLLLGLIDIIYSYAYNERVNMGYDNIESAWNICKLSGTLSCLDSFYNLSSVIECCFKRSLTFPLYRSWLLSERVFRDTKQIFQLGKRCLLKCLLDIKKKLESSEFKYYLNRLYIDDYCIWLQHASKKKLKSLRNKLSEYDMKKSMLSWPLDEYEKLVEEEGMVFGEEEQEEDGEQQFEYENQDESD